MRPFSLEGETAARRNLDLAIAQDPEFADAYACYGLSYMHEYEMPWSPDPDAAIIKAHEFAHRALDLDPGSSLAHRVLGHSAHYMGKYELAEHEVERALMLNPIDHGNLCIRSWIMLFSNRQEEALRYLAKERRLNPCSTENCLLKLGVAYHTSERYQEAIDTFNRMRSWDWVRYACLAAAYTQMGEFDLARASQGRHSSVVLVEFTGSGGDPVERWRRYLGDVFKFRASRDGERFLEGLRVAGVAT
jgi:tetratricopeptide (TPR) repeat protein